MPHRKRNHHREHRVGIVTPKQRRRQNRITMYLVMATVVMIAVAKISSAYFSG